MTWFFWVWQRPSKLLPITLTDKLVRKPEVSILRRPLNEAKEQLVNLGQATFLHCLCSLFKFQMIIELLLLNLDQFIRQAAFSERNTPEYVRVYIVRDYQNL